MLIVIEMMRSWRHEQGGQLTAMANLANPSTLSNNPAARSFSFSSQSRRPTVLRLQTRIG